MHDAIVGTGPVAPRATRDDVLLGSLVGGKEKDEMVQADLVSDLCRFPTLVPER
jgi:hypothetical protein